VSASFDWSFSSYAATEYQPRLVNWTSVGHDEAVFERLRQWLSKQRGVEATEPPRPDLTSEEQRVAADQARDDDDPGAGSTATPPRP
jgi:hypothetical protein